VEDDERSGNPRSHRTDEPMITLPVYFVTYISYRKIFQIEVVSINELYVYLIPCKKFLVW
jgi:hypothetical protein